MKNRKKFLGTILAIFFILSFVGCRAVENDAENTKSSKKESNRSEDNNASEKENKDKNVASTAENNDENPATKENNPATKENNTENNIEQEVGNPLGRRAGGYNIEYEVIGYKLENASEIIYYDRSEEDRWSYQMIITGVYKDNVIQYWTTFLGYSAGLQSYGTRPMSEPSGELQGWFEYNYEGEITNEWNRLYVYYDYDSPVIEDLDTHEKYYFRRTGDKWEWGI